MMDLVFLIDHFLNGGAEVQLLRVARGLRQRGWTVGILTMIPSQAHLDEIRAMDIPFVQCAEGPTPVRMAWRMIRQLRRWRPKLLVTFNYHADIMGRLCGKVAGVPAVVSSLRTAHVKTPLRGRLYRWTEPLIDLTVSNSKGAVDFMVGQRILTASKTLVIPNGMELADHPFPATRAEARAVFQTVPSDFVWLAVGNLLPSKDYPTLLEAAVRCRASGRAFRLLVIGGGDELERLRSEASARGLDGLVSFLGRRRDVPLALRACDAFVLSSAWEGMPNTVMEAMASGVPVVATDVGGVAELVERDTTGFIVPSRDPEALAERMLAMMAMEGEARASMGQAGRRRIEAHFGIEQVVDRWEQELRRIARRKGCPMTHQERA